MNSLGAVLLGLAACALMLELGGRLVLHRIVGGGLDGAAVRASLLANGDADEVRSQGSALGGRRATHRLHPYLGYAFRPGARPSLGAEVPALAANDWGFPGPSPLEPSGPRAALVILLGGSVTMRLHAQCGDLLARRLASLPRFQGRAVDVRSLAVSGYKQPQSLLALQFMMTLGARPELVILLDGFNEVALSHFASTGRRLLPHLPQSWPLYAATALPPEALEVLGALDTLRRSREATQELLRRPWLGQSGFVLAVAKVHLARNRASHVRLEGDLNQLLGTRQTGHDETRDPDEILGEAVEIWARSSRLIRAASDAAGADFFHFLQPNQYLPGSHEFRPGEKRLAWNASSPYRTPVERGYPLLREAGAALEAEGVRFFDLSAVYQQVPEPVYGDNCCHPNARGNELLTEAMASILESNLGPSAGPAPPRSAAP